MKIKTKILWTLLGMSLLVALVGALAVNRLRASAMVGVIREAQDVAHLVSFVLLSSPNKFSPSAQEIVVKLHQKQGRDVVRTRLTRQRVIGMGIKRYSARDSLSSR